MLRNGLTIWEKGVRILLVLIGKYSPDISKCLNSEKKQTIKGFEENKKMVRLAYSRKRPT